MGQKWHLTVLGVRGSAPRPEAGYLEYGGNTACISMEWDNGLVVLDAGSGLSCLGQRMMNGQSAGCQHTGQQSMEQQYMERNSVNRQSAVGAGFRRTHILLSHLHLDHVLGLVQFPPFYCPEMEIHLYGCPGFRQKLETLVGPPWWPVGFEAFRAKVEFHELCPGQAFDLEGLSGLKGRTMEGNHPGGSLLYRLDEYPGEDGGKDGGKDGGRTNGFGGKSLVYGLDCEINEALFPAFTKFAKESSLLIWDAGFTEKDLRPGWGHSTWRQGIAMRQAAGAEKVLMTHYHWAYSDIFLRRQEELAGRRDPACMFGREGMVIVL